MPPRWSQGSHQGKHLLPWQVAVGIARDVGWISELSCWVSVARPIVNHISLNCSLILNVRFSHHLIHNGRKITNLLKHLPFAMCNWPSRPEKSWSPFITQELHKIRRLFFSQVDPGNSQKLGVGLENKVYLRILFDEAMAEPIEFRLKAGHGQFSRAVKQETCPHIPRSLWSNGDLVGLPIRIRRIVLLYSRWTMDFNGPTGKVSHQRTMFEIWLSNHYFGTLTTGLPNHILALTD